MKLQRIVPSVVVCDIDAIALVNANYMEAWKFFTTWKLQRVT